MCIKKVINSVFDLKKGGVFVQDAVNGYVIKINSTQGLIHHSSALYLCIVSPMLLFPYLFQEFYMNENNYCLTIFIIGNVLHIKL